MYQSGFVGYQRAFSLWVENSVMQFKRYDERRFGIGLPYINLNQALISKNDYRSNRRGKSPAFKDSKVKGNPLKIGKFFAMFKRPDSIFPIVTRPNG